MHQSSVNNNVGNIQRGKASQVEQAQLISSSEIRERRELLVAVLIVLHRFMASETPAYSPLRNLLGFSFSPLFFFNTLPDDILRNEPSVNGRHKQFTFLFCALTAQRRVPHPHGARAWSN